MVEHLNALSPAGAQHSSTTFLTAKTSCRMAQYHRLSVVLFAWSYFCFGSCDLLKDHFAGLKNNADLGDFDRTGDTHDISEAENELLLRDTVSEHMVMLYDKYKGTGFHFKDGNTVRSFKAKWGKYL